ncbi:MAG: MYXO-CTERM sorting domain-containing protein [Myxococcota bacterium]
MTRAFDDAGRKALGHRWRRRLNGRGAVTKWAALGMLLITARAKAQHGDWLVELPDCAAEAVPGEHALLYPRPGLPALLRAGGDLRARIRVPVPLTPPPGRQQEKALRGWSAELVGRSVVLGGEHRYVLRVADLRHEGRGRVLRVRLPVPAWVAPGTYDLRLQSPGTPWLRSAASVRVVRAAPRWGVARGPMEGADAPIDVWLWRAREMGGGFPIEAPWFDPSGPSAHLRVGAEVKVFGACDDADAAPSPPATPASSLALRHVDGTFTVPSNAELTVVLRAGTGLRLEGDARILGAWPATAIHRPGHQPSTAFRIAARGDFVASEVPGDGPILPHLRSVGAGMAVLEGSSAPYRAVSWEEDRSAYGDGDRSELAFERAGDQAVHVWVAGRQGRTTRGTLRTHLPTERPGGCSARGDPGAGFFGLITLAWYGLGRRRE